MLTFLHIHFLSPVLCHVAVSCSKVEMMTTIEILEQVESSPPMTTIDCTYINTRMFSWECRPVPQLKEILDPEED